MNYKSKPLFLLLLFPTPVLLKPLLAQEVKPPIAVKIKKELTCNDHTRIDNYFWLNERENPKVVAHLTAENEYTRSILKSTEDLQNTLYNEMKGRIKQTDVSVPYRKNGYYYYSRVEEGKEYAVYCRKKGTLSAPEEILLNANEMSQGFSYFDVGGMEVSPDNKILAYGLDTVGRRKYITRFKNLETGQLFADALVDTDGSVAWANDNKTVFYSIKDKSLRSYKILRHQLGQTSKKDVEVFHEKDDTYNVDVYKSKSDKYIIIESGSTLSTESRVLNASDPLGEFKIFHPRERNLEYSISHFNDKFYVVTNSNAKNFRLMETHENNTSKENWKEVVPHRSDVLLEDVDVFDNFLALQERRNGLAQIQIINLKDNTRHFLDFGEEAYTAYASYNPESDTEWLRYGYTSLTTPNSTYEYNMLTKEKKLLKQQEVVGDFRPDNYESKRLFATAADGTKIPVSIVYKKGLKKEGNNPLLLYGYGSYGASMDPYFSSSILSLLDRGFVYAIAHIRGGQELGRDWYEDGKLMKKKNTFTDFISVAEYLIGQKYTNPDKLFAMGGSAGGLLMGAVANMRPDLFKGMIAAVPFVDVMTTMLDASIPLTTGEYDEWGNPNKKEYYDYMLSYSPYDNVASKNYPAMLVTTGFHDSQVQYWEPAKWVAKLREMKTDNNPVLLWTNMDAGHGGASGRFEAYKETAMEYAFMLHLLNMLQ